MFHSNPKPPAPNPTWALQILTSDYLMEGQLDSRADDAGYFNVLLDLLKNGRQHSHLALLLNAQVRPASSLAAPARAYAKWTLSLGPNVIAIVPNDPDSQTSLRQRFGGHTHPFPAVLFAGCYQVQGDGWASA